MRNTHSLQFSGFTFPLSRTVSRYGSISKEIKGKNISATAQESGTVSS